MSYHLYIKKHAHFSQQNFNFKFPARSNLAQQKMKYRVEKFKVIPYRYIYFEFFPLFFCSESKYLPPEETPPFPSSMSAQTKTTTDIRPKAIPPIWVRRYRALKTTQLKMRTVGIEKQSRSCGLKKDWIALY